MKDIIEYKNYVGSIHLDTEEELFYGQVQFIRDLVSYEGKTAKEIKESFQASIDDYLTLCAQEGKEPDRPFKGSLNVRIGERLHRKAALYAQEKGLKLNQLIKEALARHVKFNG